MCDEKGACKMISGYSCAKPIRERCGKSCGCRENVRGMEDDEKAAAAAAKEDGGDDDSEVVEDLCCADKPERCDQNEMLRKAVKANRGMDISGCEQVKMGCAQIPATICPVTCDHCAKTDEEMAAAAEEAAAMAAAGNAPAPAPAE